MKEINELIKIKDYTKPKYEDIGELHDNRALVRIKDDDSPFNSFLYGYIDSEGKEVIPCKYAVANRFSEGLAYVRKNGHGYIIDINDNILSQFDYYEPSEINAHFSNGLLKVRNIQTNKWGYIDKNGKELIPCIYEMACNFSEGMALVFKENFERKNFSCYHADSCYIDTNGVERIFSNENHGFNALCSEFSNGVAPAIDRFTGRTIYINKEGKIVKKDNDIEKENELYMLEKEKHTIKQSVKEQLIIYYSDITFGNELFTIEAITKEELFKQKKELISLIKSRLELEIQKIGEEETIESTRKSLK